MENTRRQGLISCARCSNGSSTHSAMECLQARLTLATLRTRLRATSVYRLHAHAAYSASSCRLIHYRRLGPFVYPCCGEYQRLARQCRWQTLAAEPFLPQPHPGCAPRRQHYLAPVLINFAQFQITSPTSRAKMGGRRTSGVTWVSLSCLRGRSRQCHAARRRRWL